MTNKPETLKTAAEAVEWPRRIACLGGLLCALGMLIAPIGMVVAATQDRSDLIDPLMTLGLISWAGAMGACAVLWILSQNDQGEAQPPAKNL